jgi:hypothetical protein
LADIFREVEEDIRRDRLQKLWDKYGIYLMALVVGIIAVTSGVVGWRAYTTSQAEQASLAFAAATVEAAAEGADAAAIYSELADGAPAGYATLASLRAAGAMTEAGDVDGAIAAYDAVAADSGAEDILRDLAKVKSGILLVGRTSYDDLAIRLVPLAGDGEPWRNPAREALGMAAYGEQKYARARSFFQSIVGDQTATPGVRDRAHVMIALIDPHVPAETISQPDVPTAIPTDDSEPAGSPQEPTGEAQ